MLYFCVSLRYTFIYILFFAGFLIKAQNITAPQIRCVSVLPNGNITISWQIPPDPNLQFKSYEIYTSPILTGTYTQQTPVVTNYNTNTYTCTSITDADVKSYFIYIQTVTNTNQTILQMDTVRTIFLIATGTSPSSTPLLNWNSFAKPLPPGEGTMFDIYRQRNINPWTKIASVPLNVNGNINYSYLDSIRGICSKDSVHYQIKFNDDLTGCTSTSNISAWINVKDKNPPTIPLLDSVSVNSSGYAVMGISPAHSEDVACFVPYISPSGDGISYNILDTLCTANVPIVYTYTSSNANSASQEFSVAALDSCSNIGTIAFNPQKTIYTTVSYTFCNNTAYISWSPYINMVTGVKNYEIYYSSNGVAGPYTHLGDTTATTFMHPNLALSTTYCYYVRAHSNGKTVAGKDTASSTSNSFCITTSSPLEPTFAYLKNVTVNTPQSIDISWHIIKTEPIGGFNIYRTIAKNSTYTLIKNIPFNTSQSDYMYTDDDVNTHTTEYFYYVDVLDKTCTQHAIRTDTSNSILLKAEPTANLTATLTWNDYAKYVGGVTGYNVYRAIDGVYGNPVAFLPLGTNSFVDDLTQFADKQGMFLYYVEAVEGTPDSLGEQKSTSNYDTIYVDANLYIPNSFVAGIRGVNKIFLPIGAFIDSSDYILSIYNRWGAKIYETTDPDKGWDGGGYEEGVYAYRIQYKTSLGEYRQRNGTVNLLR